jgi:hypothetical protein
MPFKKFTHKDLNGYYYDDADKVLLDEEKEKEIAKEVRKEKKIRMFIRVIAFTETALFMFIIGAFVFILWLLFG